jgi:hypothetical protein
MQTSLNRNTCAAVAAVAIVGLTGLVLDRSLYRSDDSALPTGTVEIYEMQPVSAGAVAASHDDAQR